MMHCKTSGGSCGGSQGGKGLPEVRAGLVFVRPKINSNYGCLDDEDDGGGCHSSARCWSRRARLRTWMLPLMRFVALAASMLCLTPTRGMGTSLGMMDMWGEQLEDRPFHGGQRQQHVVFVGVPEESAVLPLKALAQEMISRGYRASLALPKSFQSWVEDIPELAFIPLNTAGGGASTKKLESSSTTPPDPTPVGTASDPGVSAQTGSTSTSPCPARPRDPGRKALCARQVLGDAWGGGVGGGWGAGLGLWRGLRGSMVGARELLQHFTSYLRFYHRTEAVMHAPLVEALRRDPPVLVVADRRALAAFRACSELGLRCVLNSAGLLGDLDRPPNSIPAPYTGFSVEGQTISHRLHSSLVRLVLSLSRLQAARDADDLVAWREDHDTQVFGGQIGREYVPDEVMVLGNSCFGSLEHARALPHRVHMVGPLWIRNSEAERGGGISVSPGSRRETCGETCGTTGTAASGGSLGAGGVCEWAGHVPAAEGESVERIEGRGVPLARGEEVPLARETNKKGLEEDVWAWLEPDGVEGDEDAPVVVVQLGRGGGKAWGVAPNAGLGGADGGRPTWKSFREETVTQLSAVGCRTLWLGHSDAIADDDTDEEHGDGMGGSDRSDSSNSSNSTLNPEATNPSSLANTNHGEGVHPQGNGRDARDRLSSASLSSSSVADTGRADDDADGIAGGCCGDVDASFSPRAEAERAAPYPPSFDNVSMVVPLAEAGSGGGGTTDLLLRVMSHRTVTVLVTDGDLRSVQAALWHGKPAVVLPTSLDQREVASRLLNLGAGVTCRPPCQPPDLVSAIVDAHHPAKRRAALTAKAVIREAGGVGRAANMLQNELHTHLAATARRNGFPCDHTLPADPSSPSESRGTDADANIIISCWSKQRLPERRNEMDEEWEDSLGPVRGRVPGLNDLGPKPLDDATWYPDEPEWILRDLSWTQRHLVDVYAVYGALVMGVGLLMKLTWNLVWSLCDISTSPAHFRGNSTGVDHSHSPSSSPAKEGPTNGAAIGGGKASRGGSGKGWGGSSGGGGGGKHGKGGAKGHHGNGSHSGSSSHHHGSGSTSAHVASGGGGGGGGAGGGRTYAHKKMAALTNGHLNS